MAQQIDTDWMWRQCLVAGFPAHVRLSPRIEGGSSYATRTTLLRFSSQIWSQIINKSTASVKWQRTCSLIVLLPCIWSKMLKWWKAYASLCVFCSAGNFALQPNYSYAVHKLPACTLKQGNKAWKQPWIKTVTTTHLLHFWPEACIENSPVLWWDQDFSLCYLESRPAVPPLYNSHDSPQLVLALIGSNPSVFKTSILLRPRLATFLLKSWFCILFTCCIPTEFDADKPTLSGHFSGPAQSLAKYRKHIHTGNGLF